MAETWIPKCPRCGEGKIILAPANGYTHGILAQVEVYCAGCEWMGKLADHIKPLYVRL